MKNIILSNGGFSLVDDDDYEYINQWKWWNSGGYAVRDANKTRDGFEKRVRMHRVIMKVPDTINIDHINLDKLDNRKENLRIATYTENNANRIKYNTNTTGYKGVFLVKERTSLWRAKIVVDKKQIHIGYYKSPEEAARAYDDAARLYFREFARTNF